MSARLLFLRHAETPYNAEYNSSTSRIGGRSNWLPLTERGASQPAIAARYFIEQSITPTQWFSSPAVRTLETGRILLCEIGVNLEAVVDDRLQEMSQGEAEGKPRATVWTKERSLAAATGVMDFRLKGGESLRETCLRKYDFLQEMTQKNPADNEEILVTSHGLSTTCMVGHLLGWSRDEILEQSKTVSNCSLTSLVLDGDGITVEFFAKNLLNGDVSHDD